MSSPTLDQFLKEIGTILRAKDGARLQDVLVLEPPFAPIYETLINEVRQNFPENKQNLLEQKCDRTLPKEDGTTGGSWPSFITFLVQYFVFIRDVDVSDLVRTHEDLKALLNRCNIALSDATMGVVVLPTVIFYSRTLAKLAIGLEKELEKQPELARYLRHRIQSESGEFTTLVESSANVVRDAFRRCLTDRSGNASGLDPSTGRPVGRKVGIYAVANIALKLFYHAKKLSSAEPIFSNIDQSRSCPALYHYPAAQRVTYMYHLGRYYFAMLQYNAAQRILQSAYDQCHVSALAQRRKLVIFLLMANLLVGRFPTPTLLSRPEAVGLGDIFLPICRTIQLGDIATFHVLLSGQHMIARQLRKWRGELQVRFYARPFVQRTLARRVFLLVGTHPPPGSKQAASLAVDDIRIVMGMLERRARIYHEEHYPGVYYPFYPTADLERIQPEPPMMDFDSDNPPPDLYSDSDDDKTNAKDNSDLSPEPPLNDEAYHPSTSKPKPKVKLSPANRKKKKPRRKPKITLQRNAVQRAMSTTECETAVLVQAGLLHGYMSHKHWRYVISGTRNADRPAVQVGFPCIWEVMRKGMGSEEFLPGWITVDRGSGGGAQGQGQGQGQGQVVNLRGVKAVGE